MERRDINRAAYEQMLNILTDVKSRYEAMAVTYRNESNDDLALYLEGIAKGLGSAITHIETLT